MTDQSKMLADIGEALYGTRWKIDLCDALGVSDRAVRRWAAGTAQVPPPVWDELRKLLRSRAEVIARVELALGQRD